MKILIVYVFCTNGGVETAIKNRIRFFDFTENQIDLLFFQDYGGKDVFKEIPCNIIIENNMKKIEELILQNAYDCIISIDTYEIITLLKKIKYQGKIGLEVHTTYTEGINYLKCINKNDITYIATPSEYQKKLVKSIIKVEIPIYVLPNAIDLDLFQPQMNLSENNRPIILWVGRLDSHKNWRLFLNIAKEINKISDHKYEYWLVGGLQSEEKEISSFTKLLYEYELSDCLRWIPKCDYNKISKIYNYVSCSKGAYISTSKNESFGMTVLEAMACKCPVIANNVGALGELVDAQTGLLLDMKDDVKLIAEKINLYLSEIKDTDLKKENAYHMVTEKFGNKVIAEKFNQLLSLSNYVSNE